MKYLSLMSTKTKIKCGGIILLAFAGAFLASIWPVHLGNFFSDLTSGSTSASLDGVTALIALSLLYLSAESIAISRRVLMGRKEGGILIVNIYINIKALRVLFTCEISCNTL